ncbi:MAG: DUF4288 domain-containing protein [bacterium]|nr:DUF4288 domain-containing protein [bacterium]
MHFYSARLLFVILVADSLARKRNLYDESVVVFRARNPAHAFKRALTLGRQQETNYKNDKGQGVRWAFVEIMKLDYVGRTVDGKEVASVLHDRTTKKLISAGHVFHPELSKPEESF